MPFSNGQISLANSFNDWRTRTNEVIAYLQGNVLLINENTTGNVNIVGLLSVTGNTTLNTVIANGVTMQTLLTQGAAFVNNNLTVNGTANVYGTTTLNGAATLANTLLIQGTTNVNNNLTVNGTSLFQGAHTVNSTSTFNGAVTLNSTLLTNGVLTQNANATVNGTLIISGNVIHNALFTQNANATLNGTLVVSGNTTVNGQIVANAGTLTFSVPAANLIQTWNGAGNTFVGHVMVITDTVSAANSLFADYRIGANSKYAVNKAGQAYSNGVLVATIPDVLALSIALG